MNNFEYIVNYEKVVDYFGEWPDFNDCNIVSLHLESESVIGFGGFRVELVIETPQGWLCNGVRVPSALVKIILDGARNCEVSGYSYQNVIGELRIERFSNVDGVTVLKTIIVPELGVNLEVVCEMVVVESVVGLSPPNYAFKPTAELALRFDRHLVPRRLNAALDVRSSGRSRESAEVEGKDLRGRMS